MKKILTDCDGCLLNWEDAFHEWMISRGHSRVVQNTYDLSVAYDLHHEHKHDFVTEFNASARMGWLKSFRDAEQVVPQFSKAGYQFEVITSFGLDEYAGKLRKYNLEQVFGADTFCGYTYLDMGADKTNALLPYKGSGLFWIEDKGSNAVLGADMGLTSILIDHPHNRDITDPRITRVDNWQQVFDIITKA